MNYLKLFLIFSLSFFFTRINAQNANELTHFNLDKNLAIQGYDPVSYFEGDEPAKGKKSISTNHNGVKYYFESESHKSKFTENPEMYEPQYGGWCAYAMGIDGSKVKIDPETFKIVEGKLYLFYNFFFNNTLKSWNEDEVKLMKVADSKWEDLISQK